MKHTILLISAVFCIVLGIAEAKTKNLKKLTTAEITAVNDIMIELPGDNALIEKIWRSPDFKNTNVRCGSQATALKAFLVKVEAGEINRKNRAGEIVPATMADVEKVTRLNRWWNSDTSYLQDILMDLRCRLDGRWKANDFGGAE